MGGGERFVKLAPGVFGRYYRTGRRSIQISFMFRGARCRETLKGLDPEIANHVRFASGTRETIRHEIAKGTFNYLNHFPDSRRAALFGFHRSTRTVRDVGESWLADMKVSRPLPSYRSYARPMRRFVYPAIGDLRIRDVTPEHLRQMFRRLEVSLKTARNYSIPLKALLARAVTDGDIDRNPFDSIVLKDLVPNARKRSTYRIDPLSQAEIKALLEAASLHRPDWRWYFQFAIYSGLRTSELYALQWQDWNGDELHVCRARVEGIDKETKNMTSDRRIRLLPLAKAALRKQRGLTAFRTEVFCNPVTGRPLARYDASQRALDYCCKKAGIRRRIQYQLRHTFASNLLSLGANPHYVATQMGHRSVLTTFKHYGRWVDEIDPRMTLENIDFGKDE